MVLNFFNIFLKCVQSSWSSFASSSCSGFLVWSLFLSSIVNIFTNTLVIVFILWSTKHAFLLMHFVASAAVYQMCIVKLRSFFPPLPCIFWMRRGSLHDWSIVWGEWGFLLLSTHFCLCVSVLDDALYHLKEILIFTWWMSKPFKRGEEGQFSSGMSNWNVSRYGGYVIISIFGGCWGCSLFKDAKKFRLSHQWRKKKIKTRVTVGVPTAKDFTDVRERWRGRSPPSRARIFVYVYISLTRRGNIRMRRTESRLDFPTDSEGALDISFSSPKEPTLT